MKWFQQALFFVMFTMALAFASKAMSAEFYFNDDRTVMSIEGDYTAKDGFKFIHNFYTNIDTIETVKFVNSGGGSADVGYLIGRSVNEAGKKTAVENGNYCYSACAFAWLGGVERIYTTDSTIAFHSVRNYNVADVERVEPFLLEETKLDMVKYLEDVGVADNMATDLLAADFEDWFFFSTVRARAWDIKSNIVLQ